MPHKKLLSTPRVVVTCLLVGILASGLFATEAVAHAYLLDSKPANETILEESPQQITAWFSQELDADFSTLQVFNSESHQADNGDGGVDLYDPDHASMIVSLQPSLPSGTYTVRWTAVSVEDGDVTEGEFYFGVGVDEVAIAAPGVAKDAPAESEIVWPIFDIIVSIIVLIVVIIGVIFLPRFIKHRETLNGSL